MQSKLAVIRTDYNDNLKSELRSLLPLLGTNIKFNDETWACVKKKRSGGDANNMHTLYFAKIPNKYCDIVKYYALLKINEKSVLGSLPGELWGLKKFFQFIEKKYPGLELNKINRTLINDYEQYVRGLRYQKSSKESLFSSINNLFRTMKDWPEMPLKVPTSRYNPFSRTNEDRKIQGKYIPEYITKQLDVIFKDERIPITQRLLYWIPRSIPSRISEVTGMSIDCLKPSFQGEGHWVIFIPTWKQSGGYIMPEIRPIYLKEEGHGEYVIKLIREQQKIALSLQDRVIDKNLLFTYQISKFDKNIIIKTDGKVHYKTSNITCIANQHIVANMFNRLCERHNVQDEDNIRYKFTSHQLRHNGITDRIYEGFSIIEIRDMTGHKGEQMIVQSYIHEDADKIKEKQRLVNEKKVNINLDVGPVYFKGRILKMDKIQEERLLENLRAHRIGRLGISLE